MTKSKPSNWQRLMLLSVINVISTPTVAEYQAHTYHRQAHYQLQQFSIPPELQPYRPPAQAQPVVQPQWMSYTPAKPSASVHRSQAYHPNMQQRQQLLRIAQQYKGVRYRWGGNTPREGFDCSGFTKFSFKQINRPIPRTAAEQSRASRTIRRQDLRPGDMIFFKTKGKRVNHVGIYTGNGYFIHAASGGGRVTIDNLRKPYWQKRLYKYGTFFS